MIDMNVRSETDFLIVFQPGSFQGVPRAEIWVVRGWKRSATLWTSVMTRTDGGAIAPPDRFRWREFMFESIVVFRLEGHARTGGETSDYQIGCVRAPALAGPMKMVWTGRR